MAGTKQIRIGRVKAVLEKLKIELNLRTSTCEVVEETYVDESRVGHGIIRASYGRKAQAERSIEILLEEFPELREVTPE